jgi:acyl-CoA reductase-like NAD-dependent aldehyde dehydrogenase
MSEHYIIETLDRIIEELEDLHDYSADVDSMEQVNLTPTRHKIEEAVGSLYNAAEAARQILGKELR